jgi:hypothetical protein
MTKEDPINNQVVVALCCSTGIWKSESKLPFCTLHRLLLMAQPISRALIVILAWAHYIASKLTEQIWNLVRARDHQFPCLPFSWPWHGPSLPSTLSRIPKPILMLLENPSKKRQSTSDSILLHLPATCARLVLDDSA